MFVRSGRERRAWYSRKYQKKSQAIINADAIRSVKERPRIALKQLIHSGGSGVLVYVMRWVDTTIQDTSTGN